MDEFKYLNYFTKYSAKGDYYKKYSEEACFGGIFHNSYNIKNVTYRIFLNTYLPFLVNSKNNNFCFFKKNQIINHLLQIKEIVPFTFKIFELDDGYDLLIDVKDSSLIFHKFLLSWVRYLYEYPFNVCLQDAYLLKKEKIFTFTSILNIFNIVYASCGNDRSIHSITYQDRISKFLTKKQIIHLIEKLDELNRLFPTTPKCSPSRLPNIKNYTPKDLEYWDPCYFSKRKDTYIKNYNKL